MYGWLAKSTFAKLKLVKNRGISWGNAFSKSCSQWSLEFMHLLGLTLPCRVAWQMWPQDINDINSKTKNLDPEYFCMLTPVGMLYNIYFRTFGLTCTVQWSKWPIWPSKWPVFKGDLVTKDDIWRGKALNKICSPDPNEFRTTFKSSVGRLVMENRRFLRFRTVWR